MEKIILVAETGSDLTVELAQEYGIYVAPMHVTFEDKTLDDGKFPVEDIVKYYKNTGKLPKTSGCNPGDFVTLFDEIHEKHPEAKILYLAYSAVTTCSYQSAQIAAQDRDYVTFVDTKQVSVGQGAVVIYVAQYLKAHPDCSMEELVSVAYEAVGRAKMCFIPDNLEFLRAGGRVSNAAYFGATLLNLHPTIEILDGKLVATKKYRGKMSRICSKLIKEYTELYQLDTEVLWLVYTIGLSDEVKESVQKTVEELGFKKLYWVQAHGVITTHGGPAAFGIAGFAKK